MNQEQLDAPELGASPLARQALKLSDLVMFLLGNRQAIERVLAARHALLYGAALVATVALARNYDTVFIPAEPKRLAGPFLASLIMCMILYWFYRWCLWLSEHRSFNLNHSQAVIVFLTGYWWTAPIAWIYAIPVEMFTAEITAAKLNLWALSLVSIWRVLLFSRVASVAFGVRYLTSLSWILIPCMVAAFLGSIGKFLELVPIMGGIQLTQSQEIILSYSGWVGQIVTIAFIPVLITATYTAYENWRVDPAYRSLNSYKTIVSPALWGLLLVPVLILGWGCVYFQPRIWNADQIDSLLSDGQIGKAIESMEKNGEEAYLNSWDPETKFTDLRAESFVLETIEEIAKLKPAPWIASRLLENAECVVVKKSTQYSAYQNETNWEYANLLIHYSNVESLNRIEENLNKLKSLKAAFDLDIGQCDLLLNRVVKVRQELQSKGLESNSQRRPALEE